MMLNFCIIYRCRIRVLTTMSNNIEDIFIIKTFSRILHLKNNTIISYLHDLEWKSDL